MNVIIKINGREAIPVRALPLLAEWGTMHPEKIAGALGRVTDDDRRPLFGKFHDMSAFYVEHGTVHPVTDHHWRDHTYRKLKALSDTIKHSEISHETGHSEWRVKALEVLPKNAFVWKDEYEPIFNKEYGPGRWAHLSDERREGEKQTSREKMIESGRNPPVELNFNPLVDDDMQPIVQASIDAIRSAVDSESVSLVTLVDSHSVGNVPLTSEVSAPAQTAATPAPVEAASDSPSSMRRTARRTWRDVSEAYLKRTFIELQCPTVKVFYRALMDKAGPDTLFDKGTGQNVGSLFARDLGVPVTKKMIEGFVTELRRKM